MLSRVNVRFIVLPVFMLTFGFILLNVGFAQGADVAEITKNECMLLTDNCADEVFQNLPEFYQEFRAKTRRCLALDVIDRDTSTSVNYSASSIAPLVSQLRSTFLSQYKDVSNFEVSAIEIEKYLDKTIPVGILFKMLNIEGFRQSLLNVNKECSPQSSSNTMHPSEFNCDGCEINTTFTYRDSIEEHIGSQVSTLTPVYSLELRIINKTLVSSKAFVHLPK